MESIACSLIHIQSQGNNGGIGRWFGPYGGRGGGGAGQTGSANSGSNGGAGGFAW